MAKRRNRPQKANVAAKVAPRKSPRKAKVSAPVEVVAAIAEPIVVQEPVFIRKPDRFEMAINTMADFLTLVENRIRSLLTKVVA